MSVNTENWSEYYAATLEKPLHPLYAVLDSYLPKSGLALDLGCGVGHGVIHLLDKGLRVEAVDGEEEALRILRSRLQARQGVELVCSRLEDYTPPKCQVAVAMFSLFFLNQAEFNSLWKRIVRSIVPGGVFAGQFLGLHDDWKDRGYTLHRKHEVERLLSEFEILHLDEVERDGETAMGTQKHWHVFHVVARKR